MNCTTHKGLSVVLRVLPNRETQEWLYQAYVGNEVVATASVLRKRVPAELYNLYTSPSYRNKGLAQLILSECIKDHPLLVWESWTSNKTTNHLYSKYGRRMYVDSSKTTWTVK